MKINKIYIDMDGVLADFDAEPNAVERFATEKGFFQRLKPTKFVKPINKLLKKNNENIYILSASPHLWADIDKMFWLYEHMPYLKLDNVIFVRSGKEKAQYAKGNMLIDDYSANLLEWERLGGYGVKCINGYNGKGIQWTKEVLDIRAI